MMIQPSAYALRELTAVALGLRIVDKSIRADINKQTREALNPLWRETLGIHAGANKMDQLILVKGARVVAGNPTSVIAGASRRALSGGGVPVELARGREFGAPSRLNFVTTFNRKTAYAPVTRHTKRQVPAAVKRGRVVYPAFAEMAPRMVSLWVQIVARNFHEKFEGK